MIRQTRTKSLAAPASARAAAAAAALLLLFAGACGQNEETGPALPGPPQDNGPPGPPHPAGRLVELRPLSASPDLRIVDDLGRDVLLRGVNITSLGEYWQGDPLHPPTLPTTDRDWDAMASRGVSVVRLVMHWSRIEPERGRIDYGYLDELDAHVRKAAQRGIYTVLDMHQDAYSAFIFTPPGEECPPGTHPAKGWDGAPRFAVFTDGLSTCTPGERNASLAVQNAWNAFYDNREGIRDHFVRAWAAVAERFAGRPEVAGFDLLNEPEVPRPWWQLQPLYDRLIEETYLAIRTAQAGAAFEHLIVVEPAIPAGNPGYGLVLPNLRAMSTEFTNVASGPHNYAETIGIPGLTISFEIMTQIFLFFGRLYGVPTWVGEYGFWDTSPETLEKLDRYAMDEDANLLGGAWWQWRQPCGDPHSLGPTGPYTVVHLNTLDCPGDIDLGPTEPFMRVLARGYPRAAPGRLVSLAANPETGALSVEAVATEPAGAPLVVWTPTATDTHAVETTGLERVLLHDVPGGRIVTAVPSAPGPYSLRVAPR